MVAEPFQLKAQRPSQCWSPGEIRRHIGWVCEPCVTGPLECFDVRPFIRGVVLLAILASLIRFDSASGEELF